MRAPAEWVEAIAQAIEWTEARRTHIRLGDCPPGGRSGVALSRFGFPRWALEPGVAVFNAWRKPDGTYVVDTGGGRRKRLVDAFVHLAASEGRTPYEAIGQLIEDSEYFGHAYLRHPMLVPIPADVPIALDIPHEEVDLWNQKRRKR